MKKIIFILITLFCFNNLMIIEAKPCNYNKYITNVKKNAKKSTRKFLKKHRGKNYGKFKCMRTGRTLQGFTYYKK